MRGIRVGSVFGIPIRLDLTFLLILPLFAWLIGSDIGNLSLLINNLFGASIDGVALSDGSLQWILGSAAAIGLFGGVLLHEFGHSLVAMRYGYEIESITLWLFGGVARFKEIPEDWKQEFTIAVAGPLVSVAIGIVAYAGFIALPESAAPLKFVTGYLALMNISLAVFNMLPGFPMDGGRVLRALLARNRPHAKATQMAAEVGKVFAFLLGIFGLFFNLFLVALAFFIYMGASGEAQQTVLKATFQDVVVNDIMTTRENLDVVDKKTSVTELLERMFVERHTGYPVLQNGQLVGMVTLDDARGVREVERDAYLVEDIMSDELATIDPSADAMEAIALMQERSVGRLPVVDETGEFVGLVSRSDLVTAFNIIRSRGSLDAMPRSEAGLPQLR
ncbi:CBS domain-containing protein [Haloferax sp. YSMS24]|uniref:CBS domain-containing protein n=1 Tax=unclassified Haloferax TaxID=2625095 RepID=UPI00398CF59C